MVSEGELELPWQMILYLGSGLISGILVSLLTRPVATEKLENFYALTRTPVKPDDAVVPERRNLLPNTNLEIAIPSRTSVVGFLVGWACVAVIVIVMYRIAGS